MTMCKLPIWVLSGGGDDTGGSDSPGIRWPPRSGRVVTIAADTTIIQAYVFKNQSDIVELVFPPSLAKIEG